MITIGCGNTGAKLALMFDKNSYVFSTAEQDTNNILSSGSRVIVISKEGASKRFSIGESIWQENEEKLRSELSQIIDEKVIVFSSLGGGSGSSSLAFISNILIEQSCKVFIIGILPFKREVNPPLANSVQSISSLLPIIDLVSVMLFDNERLIKSFDGNWIEINKHIIRVVDYIVNLLEKYNTDDYSPVTLDQSELDSIIFGGGFVDFSDTFIEEGNPKFEYGSLNKETKNCMMCMFVDSRIQNHEKVDEFQKILSDQIMKFGRKIPNARLIPGILRGTVKETNSEEGVTDRCYFTIASGLSIDGYVKKIEKIRDSALAKAEAYAAKTKKAKIMSARNSRLLDI